MCDTVPSSWFPVQHSRGVGFPEQRHSSCSERCGGSGWALPSPLRSSLPTIVSKRAISTLQHDRPAPAGTGAAGSDAGIPQCLGVLTDGQGAATAARRRASNTLLYGEFTTTDHLVLE